MVQIVFAPDGLALVAAVRMCQIIEDSEFGSWLSCIKVDNSLLYREGPRAVEKLARCVPDIWVDAKLHDIPKTVRANAQALKDIGVSRVTVHASGDVEMMAAAKEVSGLMVYGVTVLTSLGDGDCRAIYNKPVEEQVGFLADLAEREGIDGIVCSGLEVRSLYEKFTVTRPGMSFIVPGTRLAGEPTGGQVRVSTPRQAAMDGATHLVVASEVVQAENPVAAFGAFVQQLQGL